MSGWNEVMYMYTMARDSFAESLSEWSNALAEDPAGAQKASKLLTDLVKEINVLMSFGTTPGVNVCYKHRCQVIKFTIEDASLLLESKSHAVSEIAEVLTMISIQVGRLTLSPSNRQDETVQAMDKIASELNERIKSGPVSSEPISLFLGDMWSRLHFSVGECYCRQCRTLRETT